MRSIVPRAGRGLSPLWIVPLTRHPLPSPLPQAGEGVHLRHRGTSRIASRFSERGDWGLPAHCSIGSPAPRAP
ncbi:hypothetical protein E4K64_06125 [Bradyrhizobium frederickii]|uniref:Uncharacterized protein n=1 Tax=Bradyrhizobium frederickii TaxID=2560054 RepID=A0A4Y9PIC3_9BRAD|nr:hypothetical protein E4K64_06125 [Bradyrhizobium frederickii]